VISGVLIEFLFSRQAPAGFAGTTLNTVSHILGAFDDKRLSESGRRRVIIRKPHDPVAIAKDLGSGWRLTPSDPKC
jgi:hypothetical protein